MLKIYLDTNIISRIANKTKYDWLSKIEAKVETEYLTLYSQAHLNDLSQDKTDNKFLELEQLRILANDNFLHIQMDNEVHNTLAIPKEAFESFGSTLSDNIVSIANSLQPTGDSLIDPLLNVLNEQEIDLGPDVERQINGEGDKESLNLYKELGITKRFYKMSEWLEIITKMMTRFDEDNSFIRQIRRMSKTHLQVDKLKIKIDELKFDENLSKSLIGKNFGELLDQQMGFMPKKDDTFFNRVTTGFSLINFFGLDFEKNKKVKYNSTINDAQHCFYGGIADIIVSDDVGLLNKCKFIYNYYGIDTKVMDLDEFNIFINDYRTLKFENENQFLSQLEYDSNNCLIIVPKKPMVSKRQHQEVRLLNGHYWGYFNRLSEVGSIENTDKYYILHKNTLRTSEITFLKELNFIIKEFNKIFNLELEQLSSKNVSDVMNGKWEGYHWDTTESDYSLRYNPETNRMVLQIGPFDGE